MSQILKDDFSTSSSLVPWPRVNVRFLRSWSSDQFSPYIWVESRKSIYSSAECREWVNAEGAYPHSMSNHNRCLPSWRLDLVSDMWPLIQSEEPTDLGVEFSRGRIPLHRLAMNYSYSNGRIRSYYHSINPMLRNTTGKLEKKLIVKLNRHKTVVFNNKYISFFKHVFLNIIDIFCLFNLLLIF